MTGFYQFFSAIRLLPGRFLVGEVSVVTELGKAWVIQTKGADHPVRGQVEYSTDSPHQCSVRILSGAVGINAHGHRFRLPNGIGQGDRAPLCQASCYDVLGDVPGHIGAAAIHLRSILPGQRPAPVGDKSAVGVHHELAARQAGVRLKAAQDEAPGGIDEDLCISITALTKSVEANILTITYAVSSSQTTEITSVELLDGDGTVLTSSQVYVPVGDSIIMKHTIPVNEGVITNGG